MGVYEYALGPSSKLVVDNEPCGPVNVAARDVVDRVEGTESLGNGWGIAESEVVDSGAGMERWGGGMKRDAGRGLRVLRGCGERGWMEGEMSLEVDCCLTRIGTGGGSKMSRS